MKHKYDPLNTARAEFIKSRSDNEFLERFSVWRQLAAVSEAGTRLTIAACYWHSLPDEAAEHLANAIMKAIADMETVEKVEESVSTRTKARRPPADLTEKIRRAQEKAEARLKADGMEVPVL